MSDRAAAEVWEARAFRGWSDSSTHRPGHRRAGTMRRSAARGAATARTAARPASATSLVRPAGPQSRKDARPFLEASLSGLSPRARDDAQSAAADFFGPSAAGQIIL